jgi:hypothetical protein
VPANEGRYADSRALFTNDAVVDVGYLTRKKGIAAIDRGILECDRLYPTGRATSNQEDAPASSGAACFGG